MSVIFFGTGVFAVPVLKAIEPSVKLVVTQPDRPSRRGMKLQMSPVKLYAMEHGLRVETPEKSRAPEFVELLHEQQASALVVASYGQILSQKVLDTARHGAINVHGSILPKYRGAAPIQRCILDGEAETGVTLMLMDKGMDTGDIIEIQRTPIGDDETYGALQDRLAVIGAEMITHWIPRILSGDCPHVPQNHELATMAPKVTKADAELSTERDAHLEYNRTRAFTPAPGAFLPTVSGVLRVSVARLSALSGDPGTIVSTNPLTIAFLNGGIELHEVQPEGKKRMSGKDFANGARLRPGSRLV